MNHPKFAWITDPFKIKIVLEWKSVININDIKIVTSDNQEIKEFEIEQDNVNLIINFTNEIDFNINYKITIFNKTVYAFFTKEILNKFFHTKETLGINFDQNDHISFSLWSPSATLITLHIFDKNDATKLIIKYKLIKNDNGIWKINIPYTDVIKSFHEFHYTYFVEAHGKTKQIIDPYALSMTPFRGKKDSIPLGLILDLNKTLPKSSQSKKITNAKIIDNDMKFIGYELHLRDFSIDPKDTIPNHIKGTFLGAVKHIPHLKKLGISHVQLMPIQSCYTINETHKDFQHGQIAPLKINYNWGYDSFHYFIPNGWFCSSLDDPSSRLRELRAMVSSFHNAKIGIIMDVVYNHLYDGNILEDIAPGCYLRRNKDGSVSKSTGAGDSIESRIKMVRRLIIDSLKFYYEIIGINGFRFDLMSFLDHTTINQIRQALGEDAILYGEGWDLTDLPRAQSINKRNIPLKANIALFNDTARDSFTGNLDIRGFIQGAFWEGPKVRSAIIGGIKNYPIDYDNDSHIDVLIDQYPYHCFAQSPKNTINYISIHDGPTLWDKINLTTDSSKHSIKKYIKMSLSMLFSSQGKIVLEGGVEFGRSKPLAPNDPTIDRAHTSDLAIPVDGSYYFHENSYQSPDITNMFNWSKVEDHEDIIDFISGLTQLRMKLPCLRYDNPELIKKGLRFICENIPNSEKYTTSPTSQYKSWDEVNELTIEFLNGPPNEKLFVIGEVHGKNSQNKNPQNNHYIVEFDSYGYGKINFNKKEINNFDLNAWSDQNILNIKLVGTPGEWNYPKNAYRAQGNNSILPRAINKSNSLATIDLSIQDHIAGELEIQYNGHIAFILDNTAIEKSNDDLDYKKVIVIHNANDSFIDLKIEELNQFNTQDILVDNMNAGIIPINQSSVKIVNNRVTIPGKSSTFIGLN